MQAFEFKVQTTVRGVAREVLRFLEDPKRWTQGVFESADGQCCVLGAGYRACGVSWAINDKDCALFMTFKERFRDLVGEYPGEFNDTHTLDEVREVVRAIRDGREAAYKARHPR